MRRKIYLNLLVAILSETIMALSEDNKGSSNLLVRKRRVIDLTHYRTSPTIRDIPYIVNIRTKNISQCAGSILSSNIILTAAHCVFGTTKLNVVSGSAERHGGVPHEVKRLQMHPHFNRTHSDDDLALLYIRPAIDFVRSASRKIEFYNGPLHPGVIGTLSGWGCTNLPGKKFALEYPEKLQATEVPLVNLQECRQVHENIRTSGPGDKHICTSHNGGQNGACRGDDGAPFAINGKLAGVLSGYSMNRELPIKTKPDYYMNLAYPPYRNWIENTMLYLERTGASVASYEAHHVINVHE